MHLSKLAQAFHFLRQADEVGMLFKSEYQLASPPNTTPFSRVSNPHLSKITLTARLLRLHHRRLAQHTLHTSAKDTGIGLSEYAKDRRERRDMSEAYRISSAKMLDSFFGGWSEIKRQDQLVILNQALNLCVRLLAEIVVDKVDKSGIQHGFQLRLSFICSRLLRWTSC